MTMTEIGALYKKDPVAARKVMEAKGMKIGTETQGTPVDIHGRNRADPDSQN